jgi:hypothetical protein
VPAIYRVNVRQLVAEILEPMRQLLGRPIRILSGYRSVALNRAVGGSKTSQHRRAEAADCRMGREREVMRAMMLRPRPYPTGQVIGYPRQRFLHIALPARRYPEPAFFVCTAPKTYVRVDDVAAFDRVWPVGPAATVPTHSEGAE